MVVVVVAVGRSGQQKAQNGADSSVLLGALPGDGQSACFGGKYSARTYSAPAHAGKMWDKLQGKS